MGSFLMVDKAQSLFSLSGHLLRCGWVYLPALPTAPGQRSVKMTLLKLHKRCINCSERASAPYGLGDVCASYLPFAVICGPGGRNSCKRRSASILQVEFVLFWLVDGICRQPAQGTARTCPPPLQLGRKAAMGCLEVPQRVVCPSSTISRVSLSAPPPFLTHSQKPKQRPTMLYNNAKRVYMFAEGRIDQVPLLGNKGANLCTYDHKVSPPPTS